MKISELWLREWVNPELTGTQLTSQLTMAGLEIDGYYPVAGPFTNVVVAKVLATRPHPQADRLTICEVDAGKDAVLQIVCGAANVRPGLTVALALPGSELPGGMKIKESKLRGELSQGMLCSVSELGLEDKSEGIMELEDDAPIGNNLRDYLQLDDQILDVDLTPNRADCFSVLGVSREVAALNHLPSPKMPLITNQPHSDESIAINVQAPEACPQYCARIIRHINPLAITPVWMKERLRRGGIRTLHPVVDITNYVMLELGQPMHAFDLNTINGSIEIRYSLKEEQLLLLDGQELTFHDPVLVIADNNKALAMAGIMGGEASAVQAHTTDILLESAFFNPLKIAGVARQYNLCSDSSQRFERGVDPSIQAIALERATELLLSIVGGEIGTISQATFSEFLPQKTSISFQPSLVKQLSGLDVPEDTMLQILKNLEMTVDSKQSPWLITVPPHRFDMSLAADVVEEIIRIHGYDKLKAEPVMSAMQAGKINLYEQLTRKIAIFFSQRGYHETINYSFVDPELQQALYPQAQSMQLLNPISSELSQMRVGLWSGLLASTVYNAHRQQSAIKFFEAGVVFDVNEGSLQERPCFAGLITGEQGQFNWCDTTRLFDFYDMKGDLQSLFAQLNYLNVEFVAATHSALHPGQTAKILINNVPVGWIGVLHPRLLEALDLTHDVMLFELSLEPLLHPPIAHYQQISKYPQIRRDLSLLVNNEVTAAQIEKAVRQVVPINWIKSFDIFDRYVGDTIPQGKKSLAISLTLQDDHRTLVDAEINNIINAIINKLDEDFDVLLRTTTDEI